MGSKVGLDVMEKKNLTLGGKSNSGHPACRPLLYQLSYSDGNRSIDLYVMYHGRKVTGCDYFQCTFDPIAYYCCIYLISVKYQRS